MRSLIDRPLVLFVVAFVGMWLASVVGVWLRKRQPHGDDKRSEDFGIVVAETLTLLALIIGFTFSMATNRYDQRKGFEEAEANAIETEFLRADLLPPSAAAPVRTLLVAYLEQRIAFYNNDDQRQRDQINRRTDQLQSWLWTAVRPAASRDTPVTALALAGMNDVINSRGHTRAALWNRIPTAAWGLMAAIAVCGNVLLGFGSRSGRPAGPLSFVLPLTVSISFLLIADIDAPRHGLIRVSPENLSSLAQSLSR
jgi:hypothetical protein